MSYPLAPIDLHYHKVSGKSTFDLFMKLSSINFELNQASIGQNTSFTTDWAFKLTLEKNDSSPFTTFEELTEGLEESGFAFSATDVKAQVTEFIEGKANRGGAGVFLHSQIELIFEDLNRVNVFDSKGLQVLAVAQNDQENDPFSFVWEVKVKFNANTGQSGSDIYFPKLVTPTNTKNPNPLSLLNPDGFNNWLRLNRELLVTSDSSSSMRKASADVTESIEQMANTLATNLKGPFRTQLIRSGGINTYDVALWALIRKGTDELSFDKYAKFMDFLFCGGKDYIPNGHTRDEIERLSNHRQLPFMHIDAYRAVKIATEAFLMVNCSVKNTFDPSDIEDIVNNVRIIDGIPDEKALNDYYDNRYKVPVAGLKDPIIPYLAVIRRKMQSEDIKFNSLDSALDQYIQSGQSATDKCFGLINEKLTKPCFLELIWSYWHEESMMVQGLHAICRRFQNIRGTGGLEPLANLEIDPLRPLNNLLWGYIQDYQHRLSVRRRAYEYNHLYGISLKGDATRGMNFADPRSRFIEAFHTLLNLASRFYKQADDVTVVPDGFPVLNGLRETHLILSEGAGNQYGDLPSTSRAEMLMEQWLLARPEFREFLPTRAMVAYPEPWMDRVAALNQVLGHTNTSVLHFNYLAVFGEKILLSIRFGNWADPATSSHNAANWAHFWRKEIQGYIHAYRAVTGVDLSADNGQQRVDALQPSVHLFRRLQEQRQAKAQGINRAKIASR